MNLTRSLFTAAEQQQQQKLTASCFGSFRLLEGRFPSGIFFYLFCHQSKVDDDRGLDGKSERIRPLSRGDSG